MSEINWTTPEQDFMHQYFMTQAKKLNKDELLEIFEKVHKQYQLNNRLFKCMIQWCTREGLCLPSFSDLLSS